MRQQHQTLLISAREKIIHADRVSMQVDKQAGRVRGVCVRAIIPGMMPREKQETKLRNRAKHLFETGTTGDDGVVVH